VAPSRGPRGRWRVIVFHADGPPLSRISPPGRPMKPERARSLRIRPEAKWIKSAHCLGRRSRSEDPVRGSLCLPAIYDSRRTGISVVQLTYPWGHWLFNFSASYLTKVLRAAALSMRMQECSTLGWRGCAGFAVESLLSKRGVLAVPASAFGERRSYYFEARSRMQHHARQQGWAWTQQGRQHDVRGRFWHRSPR
jgi:hypothetical protein